jgi:hypothetical protein
VALVSGDTAAGATRLASLLSVKGVLEVLGVVSGSGRYLHCGASMCGPVYFCWHHARPQIASKHGHQVAAQVGISTLSHSTLNAQHRGQFPML